MPGSTPHKFRVAICGGGISGLCLAVFLSRTPNIKVDLYEATDRFKEIGAGVMIWSRTWRILELLGLAPAFSKIAHAPPDGSIGTGFDYRRSDESEGRRFRLFQLPYGCIRFHRAQFLDIFVDNLPKDTAHFGMKLVSYVQNGQTPIALKFADGTTSTCDLLVGCDGIKSVIRAQLLCEVSERNRDPELLNLVDPVWTGTIAYRGLIPATDLPPFHRALADPMMYCGKNKHVVSYSISQGSVVNVVTFSSEPDREGTPYGENSWVTECPKQELLDCYANWELEVEQLLSCIDKPTRWAIHHLKPLSFYVDDKVVLLGDAAHAMAPHQGAGAGQAIEDAYILAALLQEASLETLPSALEAYQRVRLPFANHVLQESYTSGMMYEFNSEIKDDYDILGPAIEKQWHWVEESSPDQECQLALFYFKQLTSQINVAL